MTASPSTSADASSRTEIHARAQRTGAIAHLNGAQLLTGSQHADFTSVVRHAAPKGTSRQTIKNVLAGRSRGVFQGRIEVARGAQRHRRLSNESRVAAVAGRRDRYQAGTRDFRRRREMQPWRDGGRTGRRATVLSAQPRHSRTGSTLDPGAGLPGRGARSRHERHRARLAGRRRRRAGGKARPHERRQRLDVHESARTFPSCRRPSAASRWCSWTALLRRKSRAP